MTSPSNVLNHIRNEALINCIEYDHFLALVALSEQNTYKKQAKVENINQNYCCGGRTLKFYPREGVCLCLVFEEKPIFEILGLLFDISKTKATDTFNYWLD